MTTTETDRPLIASYLKRDELPGPPVLAVSVGCRDIATVVVPERYPGFEEPDRALAALGYKAVGVWRHTARAASVEVEPIE